jgi:hypothetical protein
MSRRRRIAELERSVEALERRLACLESVAARLPVLRYWLAAASGSPQPKEAWR